MFSGYLDWWVGGLGLSFVAIGHHLSMKKAFGFSGVLEKTVYRKETMDQAESAAFFADDEDLEALLMAATQKAAGAENLSPAPISTNETSQVTEEESKPSFQLSAGAQAWLGHALFVAFVFIGGLVSAVVFGDFNLQMEMGAAHAAWFPETWMMWSALVIGGLMIGFGTRMAGGCSSGHGLNGCGQLQAVSLIATSTFFGTAILVTLLLNWLVG